MEKQERKVGLLLGVGIFSMPYIFGWFLLRDGHGTRARVIGLGWTAITIINFMVFFGQINTPISQNNTTPSLAATQAQVVSVIPATENTEQTPPVAADPSVKKKQGAEYPVVDYSADWTHIGQGPDGEATFVGSRSIKRKGYIVTLDVLVNHNSSLPYGSSRMVTSFDCKERKIQILLIETYQQADAKGGQIESFNPDLGWGVIYPKSIGEKQWEFACSPKSPMAAPAVVQQYSPSDPRTIFMAGASFESDQLVRLMDKHFPAARYRPNNTMLVTHEGQTFVITVQKLNEVGIPAIYKIVSVLPQSS